MTDSKSLPSSPKAPSALMNSPKEGGKGGTLSSILRDLMSSDERRRREALYPVFVNGGSDGQLEKAFKADIALKLANIRNTCKSPADFEKLVDAVISIITNQEKSFDEIKRTTASEIDKLRSECPKPPSTYHRIASAFRENTDGSLRGPTKEALESITELSGQEMQNLAQTLLDNPRKMGLFLDAWESGDPKWKAHVQKNKPVAYKMLDAFYGSFLKHLGIRVAGSQEKIMEIMNDRITSINREKQFNIKFEGEKKNLLGNIENISKLQAGLTYGVVGGFAKDRVIEHKARLERFQKEETTKEPRNEENIKRIGTLLTAIDHISKLKIRTSIAAQEDEKKLIDAALKTVQTGITHVVQAISITAPETHTTSDPLTGEHHTSIDQKKMSSVISSGPEMLKVFQNQGVSQFNSENFANYLRLLDRSGELNLASLVQKLGKSKAYEVSLLWSKGDTKAQLKLKTDGQDETLTKTRTIFKDIVDKVNEASKSNPKQVELILEKYKLTNSKEILANISSPDFLPQLIASLSRTDPKVDILKIILELTDVTSAVNKSKATEAGINALEGVFSHKTPIRDIVKKVAHESIITLPRESRTLLDSSETFESLLTKSDGSLTDTRKIFEELIAKKLLGPDEVKAYRVVEKYINTKQSGGQQAVISKDTGVQKKLVVDVTTTRKSILALEKKNGKTLTHEEIVKIADKTLIDSGTKEMIFLKATNEETKYQSAQILEELKQAETDPLIELVGFPYTWEQVIENSALHAKFRLAFDAVSGPSTMLIKMNDTVLELMRNELLRRAKDGTINQYHEDNRRAEAVGVYSAYNPYSGYLTSEDRKAEPVYRDRSDRLSDNNRGNEGYQTDTFSNNISFTAELSRAEHIPSGASSGEIFSRLTPEHPIVLGQYLICESKSGAITLMQGNAKPIEVDPRQSAAAIILANISTKLGLNGFGPVLKEMLPLIARDDLLAKTRDGSSVREEALIIARIGQTLGLDITGDMSTPEAVLRSMDNARRSLPHTPSYTWLATSRGLAGADGRMSVSTFTSAFKKAGASVKVSESVAV